ncbi:MAG: hypothetical protein ACRDO4_02645 [Nocardioides sp.]
MTERLSQLLRDEVAELHPAPPDAAHVLAEGRRLRRRRRVTTGLAAATVVAMVGAAGGFALAQNDSGGASPATAGSEAPIVFGVGSDIRLDDVVAQVPDTVHSLHYTSDGVLVRSNPNDGASDGSGPESLTLVRHDGTTVDLGTVPEGAGPATDPQESVYVLAEARGDGFVAVVRDAETGEAVDEVPLPDLPPSYWPVPPLSLDGDTLYAGFKQSTAAVDLDSGDHTIVDGMAGGIPDVVAGRTVLQQEGSLVVLDVANGADLLTVHVEGYAWGTLSPDGQFLRVVSEGEMTDGGYVEPKSIQVYDVATGEVHEFAGTSGWGWTADGGLFRVNRGTLTTCDAATGACEESALSPALPRNASLRLGGMVYES